jgi:hypothetical protein
MVNACPTLPYKRAADQAELFLFFRKENAPLVFPSSEVSSLKNGQATPRRRGGAKDGCARLLAWRKGDEWAEGNDTPADSEASLLRRAQLSSPTARPLAPSSSCPSRLAIRSGTPCI